MKTQLNWGILSTARINRRVIPALRASPRSKLLGVASRSPARARRFAARWEIPRVYNTYQSLLEADDIDAVYIPLPNSRHGLWARRAARRGKHVLCEKPLTVSVKEAEAILRAARENHVVIMEALVYPFHPQFLKLRELLRRGLIGKLRLIQACYSFTLPPERKNVRWEKKLGGGALWDVGYYPVSFVRAIAGSEPEKICAESEIGPTGVETFLTAQMAFPSGLVAQIDTSFVLPYRVGARVIGEKGQIIIPNPWQPDVDGKKSGLIHIHPDDHEDLIVTEVVDPYLCEIRAMERAVRDGEKPLYPLEESLRNVRLTASLLRLTSSPNGINSSSHQ